MTPPAPMWVLVVLVLLCVLGFEFWVRRVTRGWPRSSERLSFKESFRSQALSHSAGALWFTLLGSSILVLLGVSIFVSYPDELSEQIGAVFLALVGVCGLVSSWCMLSHRSAHDRHRIRLYNRACREALQGDKDQAFEWLSKAAEAGYGDTDHMAWDTDLDSLRGDARFTEILSSIKDRARTRPGA